jgi:ribosomal protein S4
VASINYLINRVHTYPITNEEKTKELNIMQDTLKSNEYNNKNLNISHSRNHKHNKTSSQQHQTTKWAMFTYYGKQTKEITKLFKETNIKIAFRTQITI